MAEDAEVGALALVAASSELSPDDRDRLVAGVEDAELATYAELAQHHG